MLDANAEDYSVKLFDDANMSDVHIKFEDAATNVGIRGLVPLRGMQQCVAFDKTSVYVIDMSESKTTSK